MSYTVQHLTDLPVPTVLATMSEPYDHAAETGPSVNAVNAAVGRIEGELVYVIIDLTQLNLNLTKLMQAMAASFLPHEQVSTDHVYASRVRLLMIGTGTLMKIATLAGGQDQYGNHHMELFPTVDEALAYIRKSEKA